MGGLLLDALQIHSQREILPSQNSKAIHHCHTRHPLSRMCLFLPINKNDIHQRKDKVDR